MKQYKIAIFSMMLICIFIITPMYINGKDNNHYEAYINKIESIHKKNHIFESDLHIIEEHIYQVEHEEYGEITFIPTIDKYSKRVVIFFVDKNDDIVYKTENLESNYWIENEFQQVNENIIGIGIEDLNGDGYDDIIIISSCKNNDGDYAGKEYRVADVLFQYEKGFYKDFRLSDKINRFTMNKNIIVVSAYVRTGKGTEFLYTSKTLSQLLEKDFEIIKKQTFTVNMEKFGVVDLVSGFYNMAGQNVLMLYIVDENGTILWNFQPMYDYENFYSISGIAFSDIDGDGLKDILLIGNYAYYNEDGTSSIKKDYHIYYQKAGYFIEDTAFKNQYECTEEDDLGKITKAAVEYWRRN